MRLGKARPAEAFGREKKPAGMFPREEEARDCAGKGPFAVWRGRRGVAGVALLGKASPGVWADAGTGGGFPGERDAG